MQVAEVVPIGTQVRVRSDGADSPIEGVIEGYGTVMRNTDEPVVDESEQVVVYEVEVTKAHVGYGDKVTLEGERLLLYRGAFDVAGEYVVEFSAKFRSVVKAADEMTARQEFITAVSGALTWDGDDNAPDELTELEMRVL